MLLSSVKRLNRCDRRDTGYDAINKAYQIKDDAAYEARSALESLLIDTFSLLKSQTTSSSLYIHQIMDTLTAIDNRMDGLESKIGAFENQMKELKGTVGDQVEELKGTIENKIQELNDSVENQVEQLSETVDSSLTLSTTIKYRLQAWMSEVRLISLFKMADMNMPHAQYGTGIVTDGQFQMSRQVQSNMRTHCQSDTSTGTLPNNKLWINLGGLFRIHRIYIWNYRDCCLDNLVGTHIYADESLIGTVIEESFYHDFKVPKGDPTYASKITLHQPLARHMHVMEVQVWGSGPFSEDDLFA